jgi:hypothetical protein
VVLLIESSSAHLQRGLLVQACDEKQTLHMYIWERMLLQNVGDYGLILMTVAMCFNQGAGVVRLARKSQKQPHTIKGTINNVF